MGYSEESVRAICRNGVPHGDSARYLGHSENSVHGQHKAAIQFWETALAFRGKDTLNASDRAFARTEIERHRAAMAMPDFSVAGRLRSARERGDDLRSLSASIGLSNGGSQLAPDKDRLAFWQAALALTGDDAMDDAQRQFALAEVARLSAIVNAPTPLAPNRYGPPPDYKGQAV